MVATAPRNNLRSANIHLLHRHAALPAAARDHARGANHAASDLHLCVHAAAARAPWLALARPHRHTSRRRSWLLLGVFRQGIQQPVLGGGTAALSVSGG